LILRNTGEVCSLGTNAFDSSGVTNGTGYIYVPRALVDSYKADTNWSTYASQIRAIEDYPEIPGMVDYSVTSIADNAFEGTGIVDATFPNCESVGRYAFKDCTSLTTADFPKATSIGDSAFRGCTSLTTVDFPKATSVGNMAFYNCTALTTADFPSATSVGREAFEDCTALTTADFPSATIIGEEAFRDCISLTTVNFPKATRIWDGAFNSCELLTIVDLPVVTKIVNMAFYNCKALTTLILRNAAGVCSLTANALLSTPIASGAGYIYVPKVLIEQYKVASGWSTYAAQFRALEDYTVDGTTTGALDESKI
jgi:hypothetical protein